MTTPPLPGLPWGLRAVQLDLARQPETVDFVRRYLDALAGWGFTTLVLYLEGRIRCASFPYPPAEASYSLEEMAAIVRHATAVKIEVVPVIPTLGHCEQFVNYPELAPLAEERHGRTRFGGTQRGTLCPSLPEARAFLAQYLTDVLAVFPGPNVHLGCDEAWNMGFCELCAARWRQDGLRGIFLDHLQYLSGLTRQLGKRLWIWDDMFELFPDGLAEVPRETVLCHWNYAPEIALEGPTAHFGNLERRNWLADYERLGLDAIVCPWGGHPQNIVALTEYGRRHRVLGGLLTQWEDKRLRFHEEAAPVVAFTGALWSGATFAVEAAWTRALPTVVQPLTARLATAVRGLAEQERRWPPTQLQSYLAGTLSVHEQNQRGALRVGQALLASARDERPITCGTAVLHDLELSARIGALTGTLRDLVPAIYNPRQPAADRPRLQAMAGEVQQELERLIPLRAAQWAAARPGIVPDEATAVLQALRDGLVPAWERLNRPPQSDDWWLILRLWLPDAHGAQRLQVTAISAGGEAEVLHGSFKPLATMHGPSYTVQVPFTATNPPQAIRLASWGYGGQGITFLEAHSCDKILRPAGIRATEGPVTHPEAILRDDSLWTYLGHQDYRQAMHRPDMAAERAVLEVALG
jgi:hypothetical protein